MHAPNPHQAVADEEPTVSALRRGDERAFETVVRRYHGPLLRIARTYVPSEAVAQEVVQDTWLGLLNGIDGFRGRSSLKTWLFRILVNRAMSRGAHERRSLPFSALERPDDDDGRAMSPERFTAQGQWAVAPRSFELPDSRLEMLELRARVREALACLPRRQQLVVTLRDVEGLSSEEVCKLLDLSPPNQRVLLHRARARLQSALAEPLKS
jgi:RNA polymerase sigma-70 factor (ECF subfamily)